MTKKIILIIVSGVISLCCYVNDVKAGLIQSDYIELGDNLAVYDESTNLTWLDLSVTDSNPYEQAITPHNNNGFGYATANQVVELFSGFFGNSLVFSSQGYSTGNISSSQNFFTLFGATSASSSWGFFFDSNNKFSLAGVTLGGGKIYSPDFPANYSRYYDSGNSGVGTYLVKEGRIIIEKPVVAAFAPAALPLPAALPAVTVSEPTSLAIFALGVFGLLVRRIS
ncbi:MAG: PEP-CTERM sorting domain-containing protein [Colwelliaceae bacterium]|nr:PEP-CTERM sorting domain-containing protein [Colwelliaceae bacterium]